MKKLKPFRAWVIALPSGDPHMTYNIHEERVVAAFPSMADAAGWCCGDQRPVEVLCTPVARKRKARKAKP